jgi:ABC-type branched-subunit amino acid transport system ATPase component/ABC-type branched-subunit amino acid transport system permease subunit
VSEPGWSPQVVPGASGDGPRGRWQASGIDPDDLAVRALIILGGVVLAWVAGLLFPDTFPLEVTLIGALFGAASGLMAVGLVLTYRTTRIVNFAYGSMGGFCAMVAVALNQGEADIGGFTVGGLPWAAALAIGIGLGMVVGALVERLVIRRFVRSPRLVLTVATIGLAQVFAALMLFLPGWFNLPAVIPRFDTPLTDSYVTLGNQPFDGNDFLLVGLIPLILAGLILFLRSTDAGMAVRGMAENMDRARLLGIPVNRLSLLLWGIAGGLAATTAVLTAPNHGVRFEMAAGPSLLLPPLAAAVVARMSSMSVAFASGVAFGVVEQLLRLNFRGQRELPWVVYLVVIVVALLIQRRSTSRAELADETSWTAVGVTTRLPRELARLPEVRAARVAGWLLLTGLLVAIPVLGSEAQVHEATIALTWGLAALSLVMLTGWGGVVSLGQVAFVGVGGVTAAHLIATKNLDLFLTIGASAVAGGIVALLIGLPALRVYGQYLAVTTLAFAVVMEQYIVQPFNHPDFFHGFIDRPLLWGRVDLEDGRWLYALGLFLVAVTTVAVVNLRRARPGRSIAATRDNERGAAAVGINSVESRLAVFVMAGMTAGIAGAVHALVVSNVDAGSYPAVSSLLLFSMAVIGGISSAGGALAGVGLVYGLGWVLPGERYQLLVTGVGLLLILMVAPGGLSQAYERVRDRFATSVARRRGVALPDELDPVDQVETVVAAPPTPPVGQPGLGGAYRDSGRQAVVPLLECEGVEASYGSFQVLFGIDTSVGYGQMLALLGTNGAGKSTLLRSISGLLPADRGRITLDGRDITRMPAEKIAQHGLSLMPGGRGIFPTLTVGENLRLAGWMNRRNRKAVRAARRDVLALFPVLRQRLDQLAGDLSGGEQQQLSLAMALMTRPKLLCIDELSLGLAPSVVGQLVEKVKEIHRGGTAVVVVEQSVNVALLLCDRAVFMEKGQVRFRGPTAGLLERPDVLRAVFLGESKGADNGAWPGRGGAVAGQRPSRGVTLECRELVKRFGGIRAVAGVDLVIPPASIVGLIGHNGAGKTTLFDVLSGYQPADSGRVLLGGVDITEKQPHQRAVASLGRSFQEARLFPSLSVSDTLATALETHLSNRDPLAAACRLPASTASEKWAAARVDELIELLGLGAYRDRPTGALSTGTRRIVELGCLLAHNPAVVLLDEPSGGVAQREAEQLGPLLRQVQAETGCSLVVIEHDMALISSLCDYLVALEQGAVIAAGQPTHVLNDPQVVASYLGTDQPVTTPSQHARRQALRSATPWRAT